ncbi:HalOD1 output domain-containing protein [Halobaculum halobium]|uniref:HalOD1 output domain-containing protein n=1 Tax=Halobaculum halobium TaxID=3032281 RepID=A0ABD5T5X6_9EURY|nr:HalOD1 output domain-containing protein [Halobaculum sp. SYNS20]
MTVDNTASGGTEVEAQRTRSDWTEFERPSTAVVVAVAEAIDVDTDQLPVLNEYVDGDALDTLLRESDAGVEVSFAYDSVTVRASSDGELVVTSHR